MHGPRPGPGSLQRLPVTPDLARPPVVAAPHTAGVVPHDLPVRVRDRAEVPGATARSGDRAPEGTHRRPRTAPPAAAGPGAPALQRAAAAAGVTGVPLTAVQPRSAGPPTPPDAGRTTGATAASAPDRVAGIDLEELARRLIDPVGRLLRAELRRGRERTGRPYDRHR
ncbi:hypothetical protein [Streptomyces sulfonofaciens]|uniref:hypothetical protein n=1 Tax=Streptomyces sulfonofaciens TaxID=68272 RepID=UPI0016732232|nr:hypothetical protein [Streptomyces sulfonofaciens]